MWISEWHNNYWIFGIFCGFLTTFILKKVSYSPSKRWNSILESYEEYWYENHIIISLASRTTLLINEMIHFFITASFSKHSHSLMSKIDIRKKCIYTLLKQKKIKAVIVCRLMRVRKKKISRTCRNLISIKLIPIRDDYESQKRTFSVFRLLLAILY